MFRHVMKVFEPLRNQLSRAVGGNGGSGSSPGLPGSAFERNCLSKEQQLTDVLRNSLPGITYISIEDISGGCGAMFEINIEAKEFAGLSRVKQHRLVTDTLKSEIAEMHGIRIHTTPAKTEDK